MVALQAEKSWPSDCAGCMELLSSARIDHDELCKLADEARSAVVQDLEAHSQQLSRALGTILQGKRKATPEDSDAKKMKIEPGVKIEQGVKQEQEEKVLVEPRDVLLSKKQLIEKHSLKQLEKGAYGKLYPIWCECCQTCISAKNKAKVIQHTGGPEHKRKRLQFLRQALPVETQEEHPDVSKKVPKHMSRCKGLRLGNSIGRESRLGGDLLQVWATFSEFANFNEKNFNELQNHQIMHLKNSQDWILQSSSCAGKEQETECRISQEGESVCLHCVALGSSQRMMARACDLVFDLDMASLLYKRLYECEQIDHFIEKLRGSPNYIRRKKASYEKFFEFDCAMLHRKLRPAWYGRAGHKLTESMAIFMARIVTPCLEVEPSDGNGLRSVQIERVLSFMRSDQDTTPNDLQIVKALATGQLHRHPVLHGVVSACMNRLDMLEKGKSTFRCPKRNLLARETCECCGLAIFSMYIEMHLRSIQAFHFREMLLSLSWFPFPSLSNGLGKIHGSEMVSLGGFCRRCW